MSTEQQAKIDSNRDVDSGVSAIAIASFALLIAAIIFFLFFFESQENIVDTDGQFEINSAPISTEIESFAQ